MFSPCQKGKKFQLAENIARKAQKLSQTICILQKLGWQPNSPKQDFAVLSMLCVLFWLPMCNKSWTLSAFPVETNLQATRVGFAPLTPAILELTYEPLDERECLVMRIHVSALQLMRKRLLSTLGTCAIVQLQSISCSPYLAIL